MISCWSISWFSCFNLLSIWPMFCWFCILSCLLFVACICLLISSLIFVNSSSLGSLSSYSSNSSSSLTSPPAISISVSDSYNYSECWCSWGEIYSWFEADLFDNFMISSSDSSPYLDLEDCNGILSPGLSSNEFSDEFWVLNRLLALMFKKFGNYFRLSFNGSY